MSQDLSYTGEPSVHLSGCTHGPAHLPAQRYCTTFVGTGCYTFSRVSTCLYGNSTSKRRPESQTGDSDFWSEARLLSGTKFERTDAMRTLEEIRGY